MGGIYIATRSALAARARPERAPGATASRALFATARLRVRLLHAAAARAARLWGILLGRAQVCSQWARVASAATKIIQIKWLHAYRGKLYYYGSQRFTHRYNFCILESLVIDFYYIFFFFYWKRISFLIDSHRTRSIITDAVKSVLYFLIAFFCVILMSCFFLSIRYYKLLITSNFCFACYYFRVEGKFI